MDDVVFKKIEITGTSAVSIEDAVNNALAKAAQSVRNLRWFEVEEVRGAIDDNQVAQWQVSLKIGFALD
jgi:flavin-binding protein dodecin